jgi:hypothetical protein
LDSAVAATAAKRWRGSKELILAEFALFAAFFIADWQGLIWLSKTPYLLMLGWSFQQTRPDVDLSR